MTAHLSMDQRIADATALLRPEGVWTGQLCEALGVKGARVGVIMTAAAAEGKAFSFRAGFKMVYFPTLADMRTFEAAHKEASKERRRKKWREVSGKRYKRNRSAEIAARAERRRAEKEAKAGERAAAIAQRAALRAAEAEIAKQRARQIREAKAAEKQREKADAKAQQKRLKAETKAAGQVAKLKGTASPVPKKPNWADIPMHNPNNIQPQVKECKLRDRFAVDDVPPLFSSLRPGQYIAPAPAWLQGIAA